MARGVVREEIPVVQAGLASPGWQITWLPMLPYLAVAGGVIWWAVVTFPLQALLPMTLFMMAALALVGANIRMSAGYLLPTSTSIIDAAMLLLAPQAVVVYHALIAALLSLRTRRPLDRLLFNTANYAVPSLLGSLLFHWLVPIMGGDKHLPFYMLAAAIAMTVRFVVNTFLVHVKLALSENRPVLRGVWESFSSEAAASIVLRLLAISIVIAYPHTGAWALVPVVLLLLCLNHMVQFYAQREALLRAAHMDGLTGMRNRTAWEETIRTLPNPLTSGLLIVVDLDDLKRVNDTLGHHEGDRAIREMGERLAGAAGGADKVYRFGGDEFVVFLPNVIRAEPVLTRIEYALGEFSHQWAARGSRVTASAGAASAPVDGTSVADLFIAADRQMYTIKHTRNLAKAK